MDAKLIEVSKLTPKCITRDRSREAFSNLSPHLKSGIVELDFSNCETISLSFLDELVSNLRKNVDLGKVIFHVDESDLLDKLALISGTRNVRLHGRKHDEKVSIIKPRHATKEKVVYSGTK